MQNFSEKLVGAACTGLATLAISYVADVPRSHLVLLPLLLMLVYYLIFRGGDIEPPGWSVKPLGSVEIK
jgi:hypothetical protein